MASKQSTNIKGGRRQGSGRPKGSPNRATKDVREAIVKLLEGNVENFTLWLAAVAAGEKEFEPALDDAGQPLMEKGKPVGDWNWLRRPDPGTALKLAMDMAEFHIPKQARVTLAGGVSVKASLTIRD